MEDKSSSPKDKDQIIQKLFAEITKQARDHNFHKADALRQKLMEIAPMALSEILSSAEIIEKEKTAGLDRDHLAMWPDLYGDLNEEERNCLFYSMKKVVVPPKKVILKHGSYNKRLFLINRGQVSIYHPKKGKHVLIGMLGRGDLIGEFTFTTISLCSASVVSSTEVELMVLETAATDDWSDIQPTLYNKLVSFCEHHGRVEQIIQQKKMEKRENTRHDTEAIAHAVLLDKQGNNTKNTFKGELSNISMSGCCIDIRCSKKATARALLGRPLRLKVAKVNEPDAFDLGTIGEVVRVSFLLHNEYSVHIRFPQNLSKSDLDSLLAKL